MSISVPLLGSPSAGGKGMTASLVDTSDYLLLEDGVLGAGGPPPVIDVASSPNVSVSAGRRAVLRCRIANLNHKTVDVSFKLTRWCRTFAKV